MKVERSFHGNVEAGDICGSAICPTWRDSKKRPGLMSCRYTQFAGLCRHDLEGPEAPGRCLSRIAPRSTRSLKAIYATPFETAIEACNIKGSPRCHLAVLDIRANPSRVAPGNS